MGPSGVIALLRKARAAGITTFDTVDALDPSLVDSLLLRAFPDPDPKLVVLARGVAPGPAALLAPGRRPGPPRWAGPGPDPRSPEQPRPASFARLLEVDASELALPETATGAGGPGPASPGRGALVVRCRSVEEVERAARLPPPRLLSGSFSLLDRTLGAEAVRVLGTAGFSWVARDPFAGGRLDGSLLVAGATVVPASGPRTVRDLEAEFGPVARLAFLALPHQRTLAQAALHFAVGQPWVATTCLSVPSIERWDELVGYAAAPPLSDEELKRLALFPETDRRHGGTLGP